MADASSAQQQKPDLIQDIVDVGKKAFNPASDAATRDAERQRYEELVKEYITFSHLSHTLYLLFMS